MITGPGCFRLLALLALAAGAIPACRRPHVDGTVAVDGILKAWEADGFASSSVKTADPVTWSAGACSRGVVAGLDVLLCEYASDETMTVGEQKVMSDWQAESLPTGATLRNSHTVLAIADRNNADPSGRTIARLIRSFRDQH